MLVVLLRLKKKMANFIIYTTTSVMWYSPLFRLECSKWHHKKISSAKIRHYNYFYITWSFYRTRFTFTKKKKKKKNVKLRKIKALMYWINVYFTPQVIVKFQKYENKGKNRDRIQTYLNTHAYRCKWLIELIDLFLNSPFWLRRT